MLVYVFRRAKSSSQTGDNHFEGGAHLNDPGVNLLHVQLLELREANNIEAFGSLGFCHFVVLFCVHEGFCR